ncbi:hypothetical protein DSC45_13040 [Streptomyces sp. YIM 130001]|uniref:DUF3592 domain-containing protein n=1 Tax=Streptomyces sp. YIM 130001 TaxID=2259644 RepID=UPI000E65AA5F|nr:DUF3592 domain-containing protein [Streptomyces sp. YIM 130001]RII17822.1 hypothetical protein DSC45_13040 [Streptomyces sp. YIM 130001]
MKTRTSGPKAYRRAVITMTLSGAALLIAALVTGGHTVAGLTSSERAEGTVVALELDRGAEPVTYPVIEFAAADGTRHTFRDSVGSQPPAYDKGEQVEVLYDADSPGDAEINSFVSLWLLPLIFAGAGLLLVTLGTVMAVTARKRALGSE